MLDSRKHTSLFVRNANDEVGTFYNMNTRAALAQEIVKASSEQTRICETLIHDQHLQHQVHFFIIIVGRISPAKIRNWAYPVLIVYFMNNISCMQSFNIQYKNFKFT
jgi:hypothetical protein